MIYVDMDGVLADFDGWMLSHGIINRTDFIHKPRTEWTVEEFELDRQVVSQMSSPGFFRNLAPMDDCHELWDFCKRFDPIILTARPADENGGQRIINEKREWITEQFGDIGDRFICCLRSEKQNYVDPTKTFNILVDDMERNVEEWNNAGGIGIVHKSAEMSIYQLKMLLNV